MSQLLPTPLRNRWIFILGLSAMAILMVGAASPARADAKLVSCSRGILAIWEFETVATCWAGFPEVTFGRWERTELTKGKTMKLTSSGGAFSLKATVGGIPVEVKCEKETGSSELVGGEPITGTTTMEFTSCAAGGCKVKTPIKIEKAKLEVVSEAGKKFFYKLTPASGVVLTTLTLEECASKGTYELTGSARSEIGAETSTFGSGTGSKLELKKGASAGAVTFLGKISETMTPGEGFEEVRFAFE